MRLIRVLLLYFCFGVTINGYADSKSNQPPQQEFNKAHEKANKLPTNEIMSTISLIMEIYDNPLDRAKEAQPYWSIITERSEQGEISALFYKTAVLDRLICENLTEANISSGDICGRVIAALKKISISTNSENIYYIANSKRVLGDIYKKGRVVKKSDILATEWYYGAAKTFHEGGYRDSAITSLEDTLKITPNYKPALALREVIVGY